MEILLVVRDHLIRDQIKVGLQQFSEFDVTVGEGYAAINEIRQHQYDSVFIAIDPENKEGFRLLEHLRSFDSSTQTIVVTPERHARELAPEKSRMHISSFLNTPIDVTEFFRLVSRLRERKREREREREPEPEATRS